MNSNPVIRSKQFGSFLSFLLLAGFVWLVNWSGGFASLLARAGVRMPKPRNADGTSPSTPQLVLLQGGKS